MQFVTELKRISEGIPYQREHARNEQQTIEGLIRPFIEALGYDVRNPLEAPAQYPCGSAGRVDFAILYDGRPVIIFECKPASNDRLIDDRGQLQRYFQACSPIVAVLTNGIRYQFFADLDTNGTMDSEPFMEVNLDGLHEEEFEEMEAPTIGALSILTKSSLDPVTLLDAATTLKYKNGMRRFLDQQFSGEELHREFVELLAKQVYTRRLGPVVRENLGNLAKEVINELRGDLRKSTRSGYSSSTDAEEVEGYYIVKNILWNVVPGDLVYMRDRQTYCTIQLDEGERSRKRVCLLRFNNLNRKKISLFDGGEEEQLPIASVSEINNYADRIRATAKRILESGN